MRRMLRIIDTFETAQAIGCAQKIPDRWKILVPIDAIYYELDSILRGAEWESVWGVVMRRSVHEQS